MAEQKRHHFFRKIQDITDGQDFLEMHMDDIPSSLQSAIMDVIEASMDAGGQQAYFLSVKIEIQATCSTKEQPADK